MVKRWWDSIATTIVTTVVLSMVLGFTIQQFVDLGRRHFGIGERQIAQEELGRAGAQMPARVALLIDLLDSIPDSSRPAAIAAQRGWNKIELADGPLPDVDRWKGIGADMLRRRIDRWLSKPHPIITALNYPGDQRTDESVEGPNNLVLVEASLSDGRWLLVESKMILGPAKDSTATEVSRASFVAWLVLFVACAVSLSILAAKRLAGPLSELSRAAEQLGGSGDAPPLVPRGPQEVQTATRAFNRMQERLRRFNDDRTRMLAAMSHDLRTPLTRLQLRLEMVEDLGQRDKMLAELDLMIEMIESTLAFARDDTKHEPRSLVDFSALVEGICEDASDAGEPVSFAGPRGVTISCRPTVIRRAISNIVDNAVKYGGSAAVSLGENADRAVLTVEDEGPGIPRSEREKVFEPFYRIERSRNPQTGGVGLGLSVTRSIIWEHGGDIVLANRKGAKGLSVRIELPITQDAGWPETEFATPAQDPVTRLVCS